jgi:hypothetical protein
METWHGKHFKLQSGPSSNCFGLGQSSFSDTDSKAIVEGFSKDTAVTFELHQVGSTQAGACFAGVTFDDLLPIFTLSVSRLVGGVAADDDTQSRSNTSRLRSMRLKCREAPSGPLWVGESELAGPGLGCYCQGEEHVSPVAIAFVPLDRPGDSGFGMYCVQGGQGWPLEVVCGQLSRSETSYDISPFEVSFVPPPTYCVTVDISDTGGELNILCSNIGGDELAALRADWQVTFAAFQADIEQVIPNGVSLLITDSISGEMICPNEEDTHPSLLVDILARIRAV